MRGLAAARLAHATGVYRERDVCAVPERERMRQPLNFRFLARTRVTFISYYYKEYINDKRSLYTDISDIQGFLNMN